MLSESISDKIFEETGALKGCLWRQGKHYYTKFIYIFEAETTSFDSFFLSCYDF